MAQSHVKISSLEDARSAAPVIRGYLEQGADITVVSPLCATTGGREKLRQHLRYGGLTGPQADSVGLSPAHDEPAQKPAPAAKAKPSETPTEPPEDTASQDDGASEDTAPASKRRTRKRT